MDRIRFCTLLRTGPTQGSANFQRQQFRYRGLWGFVISMIHRRPTSAPDRQIAKRRTANRLSSLVYARCQAHKGSQSLASLVNVPLAESSTNPARSYVCQGGARVDKSIIFDLGCFDELRRFWPAAFCRARYSRAAKVFAALFSSTVMCCNGRPTVLFSVDMMPLLFMLKKSCLARQFI